MPTSEIEELLLKIFRIGFRVAENRDKQPTLASNREIDTEGRCHITSLVRAEHPEIEYKGVVEIRGFSSRFT